MNKLADKITIRINCLMLYITWKTRIIARKEVEDLIQNVDGIKQAKRDTETKRAINKQLMDRPGTDAHTQNQVEMTTRKDT